MNSILIKITMRAIAKGISFKWAHKTKAKALQAHKEIITTTKYKTKNVKTFNKDILVQSSKIAPVQINQYIQNRYLRTKRQTQIEEHKIIWSKMKELCT